MILQPKIELKKLKEKDLQVLILVIEYFITQKKLIIGTDQSLQIELSIINDNYYKLQLAYAKRFTQNTFKIKLKKHDAIVINKALVEFKDHSNYTTYQKNIALNLNLILDPQIV